MKIESEADSINDGDLKLNKAIGRQQEMEDELGLPSRDSGGNLADFDPNTT